jgi:hypothetical protein
VLASGQFFPQDLVADATTLYWLDLGNGGNGSVNKMPLTGGTVTILAPSLNNPSRIALDATSVYWTDYNGGLVNKLPIGGGTVTNLVTLGAPGAAGIALDTANVYFAWGPVSTTSKSPGTYTNVTVGSDSAVLLTKDATNLYWTTTIGNGSVRQMPIGGGTITTLALNQGLVDGAIAVDATSVYWTAGGDGTAMAGSVNKVPIGGGTVTPLVSKLSRPYGLALDGGNVYFANYGSGTVQKVAATGGAPITLADGGFRPFLVTVAGPNVYWSDQQAGTILTAPK